MAQTVIQHVLARLHAIGVDDVFGVPGDFSFPVSDAVIEHPEMRWIGCCNELNAAYAADGYARIKGVGALSTTYGVGELSALAGVAGCYAEHLPVFHLVGTPNMAVQASRALMHHTFANGEYDQFRRMSEPVVCAHAVMTPQNAAYETERLIFEALYHRRPVYMAFPADLANRPILGADEPLRAVHSDPVALEAATDAIIAALDKAQTACLLIGKLVERVGLSDAMQAVVDRSGLPFSTMFMGKAVLDEQHPSHMGMYAGALMNPPLRDFIESCDRVLLIGARMTDLNSGAFTAHLDPAKMMSIGHHVTQVNGKTYGGVEMGDILTALAKRVAKPRAWKKYDPAPPDVPVGSGNDPIGADALYPRWERFFKPNDILVAETGTASMGLGFIRMPAGASFHNQTLWGSIGWATPASFGMAIAASGRRIVLVTGEGAHQMTVQEISQFGRHNLKPIIFVLNNNGYLIERLLCKDPDITYNDVAQWRYTELPHALGCDGWFVARVTTCGELDAALEAANSATTGVYIEVVTDTYAASPLALKLHEVLTSLYRT